MCIFLDLDDSLTLELKSHLAEMIKILLEFFLANLGELLLAHVVASHVALDRGSVHIFVSSDQVENVCLVIFSSPEAL